MLQLIANNFYKNKSRKDGVVAESGSPDYLRKMDGIYSHMIQLQDVSAGEI